MKKSRQDTIRRMISDREICTQDELALALKEEGFKVTQATVSRDIREMGLRKAPVGGKNPRYILPGEKGNLTEGGYLKVFKEGFTSIETAGSILVVKTAPGMAMAVAAAIDSMDYGEIAGTIAGDDTIFLAVRTREDGENIIGKVESIIQDVK